MDRQTLRDWVIRFNEHGPNGLINLASPGAPSKLDGEHRAFLARIVDEGPIPAIHGVGCWRACDLIMRLREEFGISVSDDTVYRALKDSASHTSAPGPGLQAGCRCEARMKSPVEDSRSTRRKLAQNELRSPALLGLVPPRRP
jgi:hypothetical protein